MTFKEKVLDCLTSRIVDVLLYIANHLYAMSMKTVTVCTLNKSVLRVGN